MFKRKRNAFTLIELVAVLVIMAIIALIVTPLVMSIIRKARISADKRSVDAYGRSIELAIAGYLMDTGSFPTDINQLTIEYSGDEVVCTITNLNSDFSVYLAGCTVGGRSVDGYIYGKEETVTYDAYEVGDEITYNNVDYYVIKNSSASESTITLLKAEPLTVEEVNQYGAGHVNRYSFSSVGTSSNQNGYGGIAYYSSATCGYVNNNPWQSSGCTTDYEQSEIKYAVDAWKTAQAPAATEARLITFEDLTENLGFSESAKQCTGSCWYNKAVDTPSWIYNSNYWYWTSTPFTDSPSDVWVVNNDGNLVYDMIGSIVDNSSVVRPVIVLPKSAID